MSCDLLLLLDDPTIVKEGTLNGLYACWIEAYRTDRGSDVTSHFLLLYDPEKLCVVIISADWDDAERIAEHLEIVETSVDAPQPDLTNGRGFRWIGGVG